MAKGRKPKPKQRKRKSPNKGKRRAAKKDKTTLRGANHPRSDPAGGVDEVATAICRDMALAKSSLEAEIFMASWLPRKATCETEFFKCVPNILRAWIEYAGERRNIPQAATDETVASVESWTDEMLQAAGDSGLWGPSKSFVMAMKQAGVDMTDQAAVDGFMDQYNSQLSEQEANPG